MPSVDPFLHHHLVEALHINIGGRLAPLSIRDQLTRGRLAVRRAIDQGLLDGDKRELLVIGAGAGGVTAAIEAASSGVKVTLMDRSKRPLSRHAGCHRWVDPTQYDYPVAHWRRASIPWPPLLGPPVPHLPMPPLRWPRANRAHILVGDWRLQLSNFLLTPDGTNLTEKYLCRCMDIIPNPATNLVTAKWEEVDILGNPTGKSDQKDFGLVISAKGFGDERCFLEQRAPLPWDGHPFRSFEFWANDPFERTNLGVPPREADDSRPRVLISGGGDGAMQDFLRIMTSCKSAVEIWDRLAMPPDLAFEVATIIRDAEDQASRALVWGGGAIHDHDVLRRLEASHLHAVALVLSWPDWPDAFGRILRFEVAEIRLVHSCDHLGAAYGLNRFLTLLLLDVLQDHTEYGSSGPIRMSRRRVVEVDCLGHPTNPTPDAWKCHGRTHQVTIWDEPNCRTIHPAKTFPPPPPLKGPKPPGQVEGGFEVVVLRHGIRAPELVSTLDKRITVQMGRQVLPYHYPA